MKIKLSKSQWENIGKTAKWTHETTQQDLKDALDQIHNASRNLSMIVSSVLVPSDGGGRAFQDADGKITKEYSPQEIDEIKKIEVDLMNIYSRLTKVYNPRKF